MLKLNNVGVKIWERDFEYQSGHNDYGYGLALAPDGGYVMCGSTSSLGATQVYIVKTDTAGLAVGMDNIEFKTAFTFNVYPNPFNNYTTINLSEIYNDGIDDIFIELFDFTGKLLHQQKITKASTILYNNNFAKGIYLLTVKNNQQLISTKKIIIN